MTLAPRPLIGLIAALACTLAQAQVYKCVVNSSVIYQPTECAAGSGAALNGLQYHGGSAPPAPKLAPEKTASSKTETASKPVEAPKAPEPVAQVPQKSELERNADMCLEWYKSLLKDPRSAYYKNPVMADRTILEFKLYAANSYGGITPSPAACEFKNGGIEDSWTRIQAKRRGWSQHLTIID